MQTGVLNHMKVGATRVGEIERTASVALRAEEQAAERQSSITDRLALRR
jgi:hypothetical protein